MGCGTSSEGEFAGLSSDTGFIYQEPDAIHRAEVLYGVSHDDLLERDILSHIRAMEMPAEIDQGVIEVTSISIDRPSRRLKVVFESMGTFLEIEARAKRLTQHLGDYCLDLTLSPSPQIFMTIRPKITADVVN